MNKGVKRLVYSSSASVYGDAVTEPMTEDHVFNNKNFYGATKICGEAMLRAFHHRYGLDYVGLRYMNVYGPRQDYRGAYIAVIMKMLDAIDRGESPTVLGDGSEAFDFVAVEDCGLANVRAMQADTTDRYYNVGTGTRTSLKELAELLLDLTGSNQPISYAPRSTATWSATDRRSRTSRRGDRFHRRNRPARGTGKPDRLAARRAEVEARRVAAGKHEDDGYRTVVGRGAVRPPVEKVDGVFWRAAASSHYLAHTTAAFPTNGPRCAGRRQRRMEEFSSAISTVMTQVRGDVG